MNRKWWNDKIVYQIYPKSFMDANGDGIGDLKGIISKLDYLKNLGIDMIWLSPIYKSPFVDQGYDISDYYAIAEEFGTMEEFDELLEEAKKRDISILMDLVVNHCSDKHEWFQKALADPNGEYSERFYFVKGENGNPPTNYRSYFGGSVWEPVPGTDKFYMHLFAKEQPDLNWENPVVRQKIYNMCNWWLDKGLAGFRIDAIINIKKALPFPEYEADGADGMVNCAKMIEDAHGIGEFLQEMKHESFDKYDAFTVGEVFNMREEELENFVGENGHFSSMFDFSAHMTGSGEHGWYDTKPFDFKSWRKAIYDAQKKMLDIGFLSNIIENHDEPRGASRFLPNYAQNEAGKKMLATTSILLRGIPFLYQGQEIGMTNCQFDDISQYDDISTKDQYQVALDAGLSKDEAMKVCYDNSRDNARTPVQWSAALNAGFTTGEPWLKVNPNYKEINVVEQENRENSVLNYYKKLIALRKSELYRETFTYGDFKAEYEEEDDIFAFSRVNQDSRQKILIAANYGEKSVALMIGKEVKDVLLSNMKEKEDLLKEITNGGKVKLDSCECIVMLCK